MLVPFKSQGREDDKAAFNAIVFSKPQLPSCFLELCQFVYVNCGSESCHVKPCKMVHLFQQQWIVSIMDLTKMLINGTLDICTTYIQLILASNEWIDTAYYINNGASFDAEINEKRKSCSMLFRSIVLAFGLWGCFIVYWF